MSGAKANHVTNFTSLETSLPITGRLGIGGYVGWYRQHSLYGGNPSALLSYPELRAYLTWHGGRGALARQVSGGTGL